MKKNLSKIIFSIIAGVILFIIQIAMYGHCRAVTTTPPFMNKITSTVLRSPGSFINNEETYRNTTYTLAHPYATLNDFNRSSLHITHNGMITTYYVLLLNHYTNNYDTIKDNSISGLYIKIDKVTEYDVTNKAKEPLELTTVQIILSCIVFGFVLLIIGFIAIMIHSDKSLQ